MRKLRKGTLIAAIALCATFAAAGFTACNKVEPPPPSDEEFNVTYENDVLPEGLTAISGGYKQTGENAIASTQDGSVVLVDNSSFVKGTISTTVKFGMAADSGLIFQYTEGANGANYYCLQINWEGVLMFGRVKEGYWEVPFSTEVPAYALNKAFKLAVTLENGTYKCYLDGVYVGSYTDEEPLAAGPIGLKADRRNVEFTLIEQTDEIYTVSSYVDDFRILSGEYSADATSISVSGGELIGLKKDTSFTRGTVQAQFVFSDTWTQGGIVFGAKETEGKLTSYYVFSRSEDEETHVNQLTMYHVDMTDTSEGDWGKWTALGVKVEPIVQGTAFTLAVEKDGTTIRGYFNRELALSVTSDRECGTGVGFRFANGTAGRVSGLTTSDHLSDVPPTDDKDYVPFTEYSGDYTEEGGKITCESPIWIRSKTQTFTEGTMTVTMKFAAEGDQGVMFACSEAMTHWYLLQLTPQNKTFTLLRDSWGGWVGDKVIDNFDFTAEHTIKIVRTGTTALVSVDDIPIEAAHDSTISDALVTVPAENGYFGFRLVAGSYVKSNISITADIPDIPGPSEEKDYVLFTGDGNTNGDYTEADGKITYEGSDKTWIRSKSQTFTKGTMTITMKFTSVDGHGIMFACSEDMAQWYLLQFNGTDSFAVYKNNWDWLTDKKIEGFDFNSEHTIVFVRSGTNITITVDGVKIEASEWHQDAFTTVPAENGYFGFRLVAGAYVKTPISITDEVPELPAERSFIPFTGAGGGFSGNFTEEGAKLIGTDGSWVRSETETFTEGTMTFTVKFVSGKEQGIMFACSADMTQWYLLQFDGTKTFSVYKDSWSGWQTEKVFDDFDFTIEHTITIVRSGNTVTISVDGITFETPEYHPEAFTTVPSENGYFGFRFAKGMEVKYTISPSAGE